MKYYCSDVEELCCDKIQSWKLGDLIGIKGVRVELFDEYENYNCDVKGFDLRVV